MKKFLLLMSVFFLALNFTACSDDDEPNPEPQPIPENTLVLDGVNKTVEYGLFDQNDLLSNHYNLDFFLSDGFNLKVMGSGNLHNGKVIDLTKSEPKMEDWYWSIELSDNNENYIFSAFGDPTLSSTCSLFTSGTLFIKRLADNAEGMPTFEIKIQNAKFKDIKQNDGKEHTVEFRWKGLLELPT